MAMKNSCFMSRNRYVYSKNRFFWLLLFITFLEQACTPEKISEPSATPNRTVEVREKNGAFQLYRNGSPYYIQGAGGYSHFQELKNRGGNSIRIWHSDEAQRVLDEAHALGLTVTIGLWVSKYSNDLDRERQLRALERDVRRYKDHPALLMWAIGNELHQVHPDIGAWRIINEIAKMVHEVDPNHPTTTMMAGFSRLNAPLVRYLAPHIDILSINIFNDLRNLPEKIGHPIWGWHKAYIISEWGASGHWERQQKYTDWGVPLEDNSTQKAYLYWKNYQYILADKNKCLGSYVFYWGTKQERTHTWFSMFSDTGEAMEAVGIMQAMWTGRPVANRAPQLDSLYVEGFPIKTNIVLSQDTPYKANLLVSEPEGDPLRVEWEIRRESTRKKDRYGQEIMPEIVDSLQSISSSNSFVFRKPEEDGPYRLFVYVYDGQGNVATANIPFLVKNR
jgi:hypothetical protein